MTINMTSAAHASLSGRVAEEIRALMARRRVRQSNLARQLNVSEQWVSARLLGKQPIDLNDLERIAAALQVDVVDLLPPRSGRSHRSGAITGGFPTAPPPPSRPADRRPPGHPAGTARPSGQTRTARIH